MKRLFRIRCRLTAIIAVLMIAASMSSYAAAEETDASEPVQTEDPFLIEGPQIQADGAIVIEAETGTILYEKNIYEKFYPASTTKVLTTLVALENSDLNEIVTMSYAADKYVSKTSSRMGLVEGEQLTMEQALYGIMLESANEATYCVGEHVGGSIARFIKMMNSKAKALGCERSHFANSHGLHDEDHYTCPYDLMLIARAAYQNETFMKITGTPYYAMPATNKNDAKLLTNHHWFLNGTMKYEYCVGGKTGATSQAGYALVTYAKKEGVNLISVVMHAPTWNAVYVDSMNLLDFGFDNYSVYRMKDVSSSGKDFPSMFGTGIDEFTRSDKDPVSSTAGDIVVLPNGVSPDNAVKNITYFDDVEIGYGDNVVGRITYTYAGRTVGSSDIIYTCNENIMTDTRFDSEWPSFMIPVDVAFEGVEVEKLEASKVETNDDDGLFRDIVDMREIRPILWGVGAGVVFLIIGLFIMALARRR